jgi:hypothetical protein
MTLLPHFTKITGTFFLFALISCGSPQKEQKLPKDEPTPHYEKIKNMEWLIGTWSLTSKDTVSTEVWELKNDSVYAATSMDVKGGKDTLRFENITIEQTGAEVYYIPVIKNQNEGKPVRFKLTQQNKNLVIFENPEHDFPKKITYSMRGDSLIAEISGPIEGKETSMAFPMVKAK